MAQAPQLDFEAFVARKTSRAHRRRRRRRPATSTRTRSTGRRASPSRTRSRVELAVEASVRLFKQRRQAPAPRQRREGRASASSRASTASRRRAPTRCRSRCPRSTSSTARVQRRRRYGTNDDSFIMVHSALVDHYTDEELLTVIGHECGHIHNSHVVYLTALHYLTHMAGHVRAVDRSSRRSSRSARGRAARRSRATAPACSARRTPQVAERALTKLALGSRKLYEEFNLDAFLEQYEEGKDGDRQVHGGRSRRTRGCRSASSRCASSARASSTEKPRRRRRRRRADDERGRRDASRALLKGDA